MKKKPIYDVFISYSRKNKVEIEKIKNEIEERLKFKCWVDLSDIPCATENFKRKVIPGIKNTRVAFLFFLSKESQASENAMKEINFAKKREQKRVVLIRFNDDDMTDEFFFDYQDADIIDWRVVEQKEKLFRDLKKWGSSEYAGEEIEGNGECEMTNSTEEILETVTDKVAKFLYEEKGWGQFSVVDFKSSKKFVRSFIVKDDVGMPLRVFWLNSSDFYLISEFKDFKQDIDSFYNKKQIDEGVSIRMAWNDLEECIMTVLLFTENIRGRIPEKIRSQILIPFCEETPWLDKSRKDVCKRECNGKMCTCVILGESRLSQLIGKSRVDCSERIISWIRGGM